MHEGFSLHGSLIPLRVALGAVLAALGTSPLVVTRLAHCLLRLQLLLLLRLVVALVQVLDRLERMEKGGLRRHRLQVGELCSERALGVLLHPGPAGDSATCVHREGTPFARKATICCSLAEQVAASLVHVV